MKLVLNGKAMSGPGFGTVVRRYVSLTVGSFEMKLEWVTRAAMKLRQTAEVYHGLKERARRILIEDDFINLELDLDDLWGVRGTTHASASALILERLKEHQCAAS